MQFRFVRVLSQISVHESQELPELSWSSVQVYQSSSEMNSETDKRLIVSNFYFALHVVGKFCQCSKIL